MLAFQPGTRIPLYHWQLHLLLSGQPPINQHRTTVAPFQANSPMTVSWQRRCGDHYLQLTPPTTGMVLLGWTHLLLLLLSFISFIIAPLSLSATYIEIQHNPVLQVDYRDRIYIEQALIDDNDSDNNHDRELDDDDDARVTGGQARSAFGAAPCCSGQMLVGVACPRCIVTTLSALL